jgi:hypothetical protein
MQSEEFTWNSKSCTNEDGRSVRLPASSGSTGVPSNAKSQAMLRGTTRSDPSPVPSLIHNALMWSADSPCVR